MSLNNQCHSQNIIAQSAENIFSDEQVVAGYSNANNQLNYNGELKSIPLNRVPLKFGDTFKQSQLEYFRLGDKTKPVIVVLGGISSSRDLVDNGEANGWWNQFIGQNSTLNPNQYQFISVNYLTSTGKEWVTTEDQADAIKQLIDALNIKSVAYFIGNSYGGLVGQAFAAKYPETVQHLICICAAHENSNISTAQRHVQRTILSEVSDKKLALKLARSLALIGYRGEKELNQRFSNKPEIINHTINFEIGQYINYNANKFAQRFDCNRYEQLSLSIDLHQVNPQDIKCKCDLIAFDSDQIVPLSKVKKLHQLINNSQLHVINTPIGHDAFLVETLKLETVFKKIIGETK